MRPRTLLRGHPPKTTTSRSARFAFSSTSAAARFRCKLNGGSFLPCRSPRTYRGLKPGRQVFRVLAIAADGSVERMPRVFRWRVL